MTRLRTTRCAPSGVPLARVAYRAMLGQATCNAMRSLAAGGAMLSLAACGALPPSATAVVAKPPPSPPGQAAHWYQVGFEGDSFTIGARGRAVIDQAVTEMGNNRRSVAVVFGRIDTPGSPSDILRLAPRRVEAVRDALVYRGNIPPDRIEVRQTANTAQPGGSAGPGAVEIAIE